MSVGLSALYGGRGITLTHGEGSHVFDTTGRRYIDFFNGHGAALFGHADPELVGAVRDAADKIWSGGAGFGSPAREELSEMLGNIFGGKVFLSNSGTEAIEAALKLVTLLRPGRKRILACRRAFHGRSCGALALTFNPKYKNPFKNLLCKTEHFAPEDIASQIDEDTAAVFIEPVQGEGGVYVIPQEVGNAISEACERARTLLVADEIQSGLGRCGVMLASQITGLRPDVVCFAKGLAGGLPIGATLWKGKLGDFAPQSHGSTYGGNDFTAHVAVTALKMIRDKNLTAHAEELGTLLKTKLKTSASPAVKDVRGAGLLVGVEIEKPSLDVVKEMQKNGLIALAAGPRVVRFLPSFAVTADDVEEAVKIFNRSLEVIS